MSLKKKKKKYSFVNDSQEEEALFRLDCNVNTPMLV
jgi:hypothetical protein